VLTELFNEKPGKGKKIARSLTHPHSVFEIEEEDPELVLLEE